MSDSIISKMEQKNNEKSNATQQNTPQQNEYQELCEQILCLFKGKSSSLCKQVLKDLITHGIDKKSTVN